MKKNHVYIILLASMLGILIGIQFKSNYHEELEFSFLDSQLITEMNKVRSENRELLTKKEYLNDQLEILEKNKIKNEEGKQFKEKVDELKSILGYKEVNGPGIIIKIDTTEDVNLGFLMEENKILINLINEIRIYGGESISINDQRISPYSEITLAGNHINVNSIPIAQPYEIKVIGDKKRLDKRVNKDNVLIDMMTNIYKLDVNVSSYDEINIPKMEREKKLKYAQEDLETEI